MSNGNGRIGHRTAIEISLVVALFGFVWWFATERAEAAAQRNKNTEAIVKFENRMDGMANAIHRLEVHFGTLPMEERPPKGEK